MTTKEKIEEIELRNEDDWEFEASKESPDISYYCCNAMLEIAQWKEEQLIDKACKWLEENIDNYYQTCEFESFWDDMIKDFKKAMEE